MQAPAVQWQVFPVNSPGPARSPYEAERTLSETVLRATRALNVLEVAGGEEPELDTAVRLAAGYPPRSRVMADRALRLLAACEHALACDGGARSSYEVEARHQHLVELRSAATDALTAACCWR